MHPCCGGSLQTGTKIIAIFNIVVCIIFILIGVFAIIGGDVTGSALAKLPQEIGDESQVAGTTLDKNKVKAYVTLVFALSLLINILLLVGANMRNRTMCMVWFILSAIGLVFTIMGLFIGLTQGPSYVTIGRFGGTLLSVYFMWVVWVFMSELKKGPGLVVTPYANSKA